MKAKEITERATARRTTDRDGRPTAADHPPFEDVPAVPTSGCSSASAASVRRQRSARSAHREPHQSIGVDGGGDVPCCGGRATRYVGGTRAPRSSAARGGDPSAVIFDAIERDAARSTPCWRHHPPARKTNCWELRKAQGCGQGRRPGDRGAAGGRCDHGQNGLTQARVQRATRGDRSRVDQARRICQRWHRVAIETELGLPVKLIGLGESIGDLVPFDPVEFIDALVRED